MTTPPRRTEYRDFVILESIAGPAYGYLWQHKDWDLDDNRMGDAKTIELCKSEIDEWYLDNEEGN